MVYAKSLHLQGYNITFAAFCCIIPVAWRASALSSYVLYYIILLCTFVVNVPSSNPVRILPDLHILFVFVVLFLDTINFPHCIRTFFVFLSFFVFFFISCTPYIMHQAMSWMFEFRVAGPIWHNSSIISYNTCEEVLCPMWPYWNRITTTTSLA